MSVSEPPISSARHRKPHEYPPGKKHNPYEGRWRWWYSGISDWMIQNPGKPLTECAVALGKIPGTISAIAHTDMFRDFHAARLREWRRIHDFTLSAKLIQVTEEGLDLTLELMKDKRTKLAPAFLKEVTTMGLEALGYGQKAPSVAVNVDSHAQTVVIPVDASALLEAREALRLAEQRRASTVATLEVFDGPPGSSTDRCVETDLVEAPTEGSSQHEFAFDTPQRGKDDSIPTDDADSPIQLSDL